MEASHNYCKILEKLCTKDKLEYRDKVILAPMVRGSTLPLRICSLFYGADIVYTPELIDYKVGRFERYENRDLNLIEFYDPQKINCTKTPERADFKTFKGENVVLQLGTSDAQRALKAASKVANDVKGIDINMGCPFKFSVSGGMGAALLETPELVRDIIATLKRNLNLSVSCKIRVLQCPQKSLDLVRRLEMAGADALTLRPHYVTDRRLHPARLPLIKDLADSIKIPTIYNGDIFEQNHVALCRRMTGCDSVMIGRGALWNPSLFDKKGFRPLSETVPFYTAMSMSTRNNLSNTKFVLGHMLRGRFSSGEAFAKMAKVADWEEMGDFLGVFLDRRNRKAFERYEGRSCNKDVNSSYFYNVL